MIYLDNAATTFPKPECVYNKVNSVQRTIAVNVGRGSYSVASEAMRIVDETRRLLATFVGVAVLIYRRKRIDKTYNFD